MNNLPQLILIIGVAGSGKSEIGKLLSKKLKYVYIDKDTATRPFTENFLTMSSPHQNKNDRESDFYLEYVRPLEYLISLDLAEENIRLGNSVIISAPFLGEARSNTWLRQEINFRRRLNGKVCLKVVLVESDRTTERKRMLQRDAGRDKWKLSNWEEYCSAIQDFRVEWNLDPQSFFQFDNSEIPPVPFKKQMEELSKWIQAK